MQEFYKIADLRVETHRHRCLMNDFSGCMSDHRNTKHFFGVCIGDHLDYAGCVSDRACPRYERHRNGITSTIVPSRDRFLLGHADGYDLGIGEDSRGMTRWLTRRGFPSAKALWATMPPSWLPTAVALWLPASRPITSPPAKMCGTFVRRNSSMR